MGFPVFGVTLAGIFPRSGLHTRPATAARNGLFGYTEPLRKLNRALAVDHLHFFPLWRADWRVRQAEKGLRMSEPAGRVCADPA